MSMHRWILWITGNRLYPVRCGVVRTDDGRIRVHRVRRWRLRFGRGINWRMPELWRRDILNRYRRKLRRCMRTLSHRHILGRNWGIQQRNLRVVRTRHIRRRRWGHVALSVYRLSERYIRSLAWLYSMSAGDLFNRDRRNIQRDMCSVPDQHLRIGPGCNGLRRVSIRVVPSCKQSRLRTMRSGHFF